MPPRCRERTERPWRHGRRLDPPEPCAAQRRRRRARTPRSPARHGSLTRTRRFGSRAPHCRTPPRGGCLAPGAPLQPAAGNSDGLSPAATCQAPRGFQVARARPKEEGSTTSSTTQATLTSSHPRWPASRPTPSPNPAVDPLAHTVDVSSSPHYPVFRTHHAYIMISPWGPRRAVSRDKDRQTTMELARVCTATTQQLSCPWSQAGPGGHVDGARRSAALGASGARQPHVNSNCV